MTTEAGTSAVVDVRQVVGEVKAALKRTTAGRVTATADVFDGTIVFYRVEVENYTGHDLERMVSGNRPALPAKPKTEEGR